MKKFMTILAFLFIVLSWKSVSYGAEGNVWGAIDQDSEEFQQIYKCIIAHGEDLSFIGIQNTDMEESSIHAEEIKRVYYTNPGMLDEAKKRQSFTDLSSKFCQYKIPYEEGDYIYVISLMKAENAVTFLGTSQGMVEGNVIDNALRITPEELSGNLSAAGIDPDAVVSCKYYLVSDFFDSLFICINTKEQEYLMIYCYYPEELGIENGKPYVTQEAIEILEKVNNPLAPGELGGSMASGDGDNAYAKKPSAQIICIVCIIVGLVACVLCVRVFIRRKIK